MIVIIDYGSGNVRSVVNAFQAIDAKVQITSDPEIVRKADKVVFPGVGDARQAMDHLKRTGLAECIPQLQVPFLGICLGLQLMCKYTEEGGIAGFGIFDTDVLHFPPEDIIPHTGWNDFTDMKGELFEGLQPTDHMYFVHSFYARVCVHTVAVSQYLLPFSAALQKDHFFAVQFHPEKSAESGLKLLKNFVRL